MIKAFPILNKDGTPLQGASNGKVVEMEFKGDHFVVNNIRDQTPEEIAAEMSEDWD